MAAHRILMELNDLELDRLIDGCTTHRLGRHANLIEIRRAGLEQKADAVLAWFQSEAGQLGDGPALIAALKLLRLQRRALRASDAKPELVLTGPETGTAHSRDTRVIVAELLQAARQSVLIVGYAFHQSERIFAPLAARMARKAELNVRMIVNIKPVPGQPAELTVNRFAADFWERSWPLEPRPEVYYLPDSLTLQGSVRTSMHAKLIVIDKTVVYLGSANFTEAAFDRNIEAGIRLKSQPIATELTHYFDGLILNAKLCALPKA